MSNGKICAYKSATILIPTAVLHNAKKMKYFSILILIIFNISCKNDKKTDNLNLKTETELKTDSVNAYNELANT